MVIPPRGFLERADHRTVGLPEIHAAAYHRADPCDRIAFAIVPAGNRCFDLGGKLVNKNSGKLGNAGEVDVESRSPDLRALHEFVDREILETALGNVSASHVDDLLP